MKILARNKFSRKFLEPDDTIRLILVKEFGGISNETIVLEGNIGRNLTINEAVIFDVEKGDFGAEDGIGGAFLQTKRNRKEGK